MAYVPKEDENEQSGMNVLGEGQESAIEAEQSNLSSTGGAAPSAASAPTSPTSQKTQTSGQSNSQSAGGSGSGTFTNLAKYREANKPAAQGIADAVSQGSQNKANEIGQAVTEQKSQFQSQVDDNRARMEAASNFANQQIQNAGTNTTEEDTTRFQELMTQPNQFTNASANFVPQEQLASQMANTAQDANRQDARMQLLRQTFGGQDPYTSGQQNLDDLIISGDQGARQTIAEAPKMAVQGLQDQINAAKQYTSAQQAALGQEEAAMKEGLQSGVDTAQQALIDRLQGQVDETNAGLGSIPALQEAFQTGEFSQELIDELGLEDNRMYGVDAQQYLQGQATLANIANQEDYARAQALANLEGTSQDTFLNPNEIGTYSENTSASLDSLRDAVAAQKSAYESAVNPFQSKISEIEGLSNYMGNLAIDPSQLQSVTGTHKASRDMASQNNMKAVEDSYLKGLSGMGVDPETASMLAKIQTANDFGVRGKFSNYSDTSHAGYMDDLMTQDFINSLRNDQGYRRSATIDDYVDLNRGQISDIQKQYGYGDVLSAEDGGVKQDSPRLASIKKMLGY